MQPGRIFRRRLGHGDHRVRPSQEPERGEVAESLAAHSRPTPHPWDQVVQRDHQRAWRATRQMEVDRVVDVGADAADVGG